MTIIEPNKNKSNLLIALTVGLIILGAVLTIFAYNQSVRFSHALSDQRKSIDSLQVKNAELKNQLYAILDIQKVDQLAEKLGLIKERKPEYLARH